MPPASETVTRPALTTSGRNAPVVAASTQFEPAGSEVAASSATSAVVTPPGGPGPGRNEGRYVTVVEAWRPSVRLTISEAVAAGRHETVPLYPHSPQRAHPAAGSPWNWTVS